jgi:hypothetical protein
MDEGNALKVFSKTFTLSDAMYEITRMKDRVQLITNPGKRYFQKINKTNA